MTQKCSKQVLKYKGKIWGCNGIIKINLERKETCWISKKSKLQNIIKLQESVQPTHIQLYPTERIIITQASLKPGSRNNTEYSPLREKLTEWECPAQ